MPHERRNGPPGAATGERDPPAAHAPPVIDVNSVLSVEDGRGPGRATGVPVGTCLRE